MIKSLLIGLFLFTTNAKAAQPYSQTTLNVVTSTAQTVLSGHENIYANTSGVSPVIQLIGENGGEGIFSASGNSQFSLVTSSGINVLSGGVYATFFTGNFYGTYVGPIPWADITNFPTGCSLPNVVTAVGSTLTCAQPSNVTGNAATVTTNANQTGDVTSVGNVTTAAATQTNITTLTSPTTHTSTVTINAGTNTNYSLQTSSGINVQAGTLKAAGAIVANVFEGAGTGLTGTGSGFTAGSATNISGGSANQLPYQSGAGTTGFIGSGSAGQVLTYGTPPSWQASMGGGGSGTGITPVFFTTGVSSNIANSNTAYYDQVNSTYTLAFSTISGQFSAGSVVDFINQSATSTFVITFSSNGYSQLLAFDNTNSSTNTALNIPAGTGIQMRFSVAGSTIQWLWSNNPSFSNFCNSTPITYSTVGNSTYTARSGCGAALVQLWAGGGGGAGCNDGSNQSGSGGGGATAICPMSPGLTYNITVGSGGVGGISAVAGTGGGPSTFYLTATSSVSATPGLGGILSPAGQQTAGGIGSINGCIVVWQSSGGYGNGNDVTGAGGGGGAAGGGPGGLGGNTTSPVSSLNGGPGGTGTNGGAGGNWGQSTSASAGALPGGGGGSCSYGGSANGGNGGSGEVIITPLPTVGSWYNAYNQIIGGGWTVAAPLTYTGNSVLTTSSMTVSGTGGLLVTGPITASSATFVGVSVSSAAAGGAGASVTALCNKYGTNFAIGGGCSCTGAVGITSVINEPNNTTPGAVPTGWTCQDAGGTGAACAAFVICSRLQ